VSSPPELAAELSKRAVALRDRWAEAIGGAHAHGTLAGLHAAFRQAAPGGANEGEIAGAIAQTVTYGLFTARLFQVARSATARGRFAPTDALALLPVTSPLLDELFRAVLGPEGRNEGVPRGVREAAEEIVRLLDSVDVERVFSKGPPGAKAEGASRAEGPPGAEGASRAEGPPGAKAEGASRAEGSPGAGEDPVIHFYDAFLAAHDEATRSKRGVYATPRALVTYVVRGVHELLQREFGLTDGLASTDSWGDVAARCPEIGVPTGVSPSEPFVRILDPATGTGTFLCECVRVVEQTMKARFRRELQGIRESTGANNGGEGADNGGGGFNNRGGGADNGGEGSNHERERADNGGEGANNGGEGAIEARWREYVPRCLLPRLWGFEIMAAPWAVAHFALAHALGQSGYRWTGTERLNVFLRDALGAEAPEGRFTVVVGNPPYAGLSSNMGARAQGLVAGYRHVDGAPLKERKLWLQDDYVKFFGLAEEVIRSSGAGALGYVTNHGFLDNPTFRGMRRSLLSTFSRLHLLDLHGSSNKRESGPLGADDENVFDIRQGVALCLAARRPGQAPSVGHAELWGSRQEKLRWLDSRSIATTPWASIAPLSPHSLFEPERSSHRGEYERGAPLDEVFSRKSAGFITARDHFVVDFDREALLARMRDFADPALSDEAIRELYFAGTGSKKYPDGDTRSFRLSEARRRAREEGPDPERARRCLIRPFDERYVYWADWMVDWPRPELSRHLALDGNVALITTRMTKDPFGAFVTRGTPGHKSVSAYDVSYVFPLYLQPDRRSGGGFGERRGGQGTSEALAGDRRANLNSAFLDRLARALGDGSSGRAPSPEEVFHYVYAVLYSPAYRERYAELLAVDFPRIPLPRGRGVFDALAALGGALVEAHWMSPGSLSEATGGAAVAKGGAAVAARGAVVATRGAVVATRGAVVATGVVGSVVEKVSHARQAVWTDRAQTRGFVGVPEAVFRFQIGGHRVCERWLVDRRGRLLTDGDVEQYRGMLVAVSETLRAMERIDEVIRENGGIAAAFQ